jgi:hypothetical protein
MDGFRSFSIKLTKNPLVDVLTVATFDLLNFIGKTGEI